MSTKHKIVVCFEKVKKAATYGGTATEKNMGVLVNRMFPNVDLNKAVFTLEEDGRVVGLDLLADHCNRSDKEVLVTLLADGTKSNKKLNSRMASQNSDALKGMVHSRNNSGPARSVHPLIEVQERITWPDILDTDRPLVLFNCTNLAKLKIMVENLEDSPSDIIFLYRILDNEFSESVYFYYNGVLINSIEFNERTEENVKRFMIAWENREDFQLVSEEDQRDDHLPLEELQQLLTDLEENKLMNASKIIEFLRAYNLRPLIVKPLVRDYLDSIISLEDLA